MAEEGIQALYWTAQLIAGLLLDGEHPVVGVGPVLTPASQGGMQRDTSEKTWVELGAQLLGDTGFSVVLIRIALLFPRCGCHDQSG